jgi:hypothetical protein
MFDSSVLLHKLHRQELELQDYPLQGVFLLP